MASANLGARERDSHFLPVLCHRLTSTVIDAHLALIWSFGQIKLLVRKFWPFLVHTMRYRAHRGSHFLSNCLLKCLVVNMRKKNVTQRKTTFVPQLPYTHMRETNTHRVRHPLIIAQENFTLSFDGAPFLTPPLSGVSFQPFTHVLAKVRLNQCQIALIIIIAFISHFHWFWSDLLWFYCCLLAPVRMMIHDLPGGCWLLGIWSMCRG